MLGESVNATPNGNQQAVEEFLASACASKPQLSNKKDNRQNDAVSDESTSHDKVRQTLPNVISFLSTES